MGIDNWTLPAIVVHAYEPGSADTLSDRYMLIEEKVMLKGDICVLRNRFDDGMKYMQKVVSSENCNIRAWAYTALTSLCYYKGYYAEGASWLTKLFEQAKENGHDSLMAKGLYSAYASMMYASNQGSWAMQTVLETDTSKIPDYIRTYFIHVYCKMLLNSHDYDGFISAMNAARIFRPINEYPLFGGYLMIEYACALLAQNREKEAEEAVKQACMLLEPDGFVYPFAQNLSMLSSSLILVIADVWPSCAEQLKLFWKNENHNWIEAYNRRTGQFKACDLTRREFEVAKLTAGGYSNKEIAEKLKISVNTVKMNLRTIFDKLQIENRKQISSFIFSYPSI